MDKGQVESTEEYVIVITTVSILGLLLVLGAVANIILLFAFNRRPALRSISNRLVGNLLVVNLFSTLVLIPFVCVDLLGAEGKRLESGPTTCSVRCYIEEFASSAISSGSLFSTLLIALDQYLAILYPLRYHHLLTSFKSWILIAVAWGLAFAVGAAKNIRRATLIADEFDNLSALTFNDSLSISNGANFYSAGTFAVIFVVPSILLAFIYGRIYMEAHKNLERTRREKINPVRTMLSTAIKITDRMGEAHKKKKSRSPLKKRLSLLLRTPKRETPTPQAPAEEPPVTEEVAPLNTHPPLKPQRPLRQLERSKTTGCLLNSNSPSPRTRTHLPLKRSHSQQIMHSIRHKLSNASQFMHRHKEEMHTARISLVSVILVLICWLPYYVVGLFVDDREPVVVATERTDHLWITCFVDVMIALYTVLSPCVFAYRCKRLQREVGRLFQAVRRTEDQDLNVSRRHVGLHQRNENRLGLNAIRDSPNSNFRRKPMPNFLLSTPPNPAVRINDAHFKSLTLPKVGSSPALALGPLRAVINEDSQRSSISSASGHSVLTQLTTAEHSKKNSHRTSNDEDEGLTFICHISESRKGSLQSTTELTLTKGTDPAT